MSLYVEAAKALQELGIRYRGGFFSGPDDYAQGLLDLACAKLLQVQLVRNVDGGTFYQVRLARASWPRAAGAGTLKPASWCVCGVLGLACARLLQLQLPRDVDGVCAELTSWCMSGVLGLACARLLRLVRNVDGGTFFRMQLLRASRGRIELGWHSKGHRAGGRSLQALDLGC